MRVGVAAHVLRLAAAVLLLGCAPAMAAECQGSIGSETSITGKTEYDPYRPSDIADSYRLTVRNTGAAACSFGLAFRTRTPRPQLGGTLTYALVDGNDAPLLPNTAGGTAPSTRLRGQLEPAAQGQIEFQVIIPRGQFAAPGLHRDTLDLELYSLDPTGRPQGASLHTTPLAIAYSVPRVMSMNLRGGELATTLSFGILATGQQRSVEIEARSNDGYQIDVASDNYGALTLTPAPPGQKWNVPYSVTLGGQRLDFSGAARLTSLPATLPANDAAYPLIVTIGDIGQKRAGRYEDVITLEIRADVR
jgi:hypothetical protein